MALTMSFSFVFRVSLNAACMESTYRLLHIQTQPITTSILQVNTTLVGPLLQQRQPLLMSCHAFGFKSGMLFHMTSHEITLSLAMFL